MMNRDPIETIFTLYILSLYPGLYLYAGWNAWRGLPGQVTMTHFGFKTGWIARVYGVFYILVLIGLTASIPVWWESLKGLTLDELASSFAVHFPADLGIGIFFALMGLFSSFILWWAVKLGQKRNPDKTEKIKKRTWFRFYYFSFPSLLVWIGIIFAIGAPIVLALGPTIIWTYVALWAEESRLLDHMAGEPS